MTAGPRDWSSHPPYIYPDYRSTPLRGPTKPLVPLGQTLSELTGLVSRQLPRDRRNVRVGNRRIEIA